MHETRKFLREMKQRDCSENIRGYKEDLHRLRYFINPYDVTMSHSKIEKRIGRIEGKTKTPE